MELYKIIDDEIQFIVDRTTLFPGVNISGNFGTATIDDEIVAFTPINSIGSTNSSAIYLSIGDELFKVLDDQTILDGKGISRLLNTSYNANQLAFYVEFDDQTKAIYLANLTITGLTLCSNGEAATIVNSDCTVAPGTIVTTVIFAAGATGKLILIGAAPTGAVTTATDGNGAV